MHVHTYTYIYIYTCCSYRCYCDAKAAAEADEARDSHIRTTKRTIDKNDIKKKTETTKEMIQQNKHNN